MPKLFTNLRTRCVGIQKRREVGGINLSSTIMIAFFISIGLGALGGAAYEVGHAVHPNYAQEQAQTIADNVSEEIQAAARCDTSMQSKLDWVGSKTWTQTVTVDNTSTTATITANASGALAWIDVSVNGESARTFAPLTSNTVCPGSTVTGG